MMCCGFSTSRLRKFLRFRALLVLAVFASSVVLLLRSGYVRLAPPNLPDPEESSSSGNSGGSSSGSGGQKIIKDAIEDEIKSTSALFTDDSKDLQTSNLEGEKQSTGEHRVVTRKQTNVKSYLEILDEINPSHSLKNDKTYPVDKLKIFTQLMNEKQIILNQDRFPKRPKNGAILIVQVHKRLEYLVHLFSSLEKAKGVENVLLIISSDWYSDAIMNAVKQIKFCQVMHIFFPFAQQLHPDHYPGTDPNDCPRDISKDEAKRKKCNNAETPDKYGHYREAEFTMTKHHWWWKANAVFDKLRVTKNSQGPVVFLEEDHFVAPDFFHSLNLLHKLKQRDKQCQNNCEILNLGMYVKAENYFTFGKNQVSLTVWRSYDHNMGMTLYRDGWNKIKGCSEVFCTYDDYNWDWTLMHISIYCLNNPLKVLSMDLPRLFHIGECGMHHKGECNANDIVKRYEELIKENADAFFVKKLVIGNTEDGSAHAGVQNGGWGDQRDHSLCKSFVKQSPR